MIKKSTIFISEIYLKYQEIINYLVIGVLTTVLSLGVKYFLLFTVFNPKDAWQLELSVIISWVIAIFFAYISNRIFVFKSKNKKIIKEMIMFFSSRLVTLVMESAILWFLITYLKLNTDTYVIIWTLFAQLIVIIGNYVLGKFVVFSVNDKKKII